MILVSEQVKQLKEISNNVPIRVLQNPKLFGREAHVGQSPKDLFSPRCSVHSTTKIQVKREELL